MSLTISRLTLPMLVLIFSFCALLLALKSWYLRSLSSVCLLSISLTVSRVLLLTSSSSTSMMSSMSTTSLRRISLFSR
ncbi:MAG: hypothetical protein BWX71_02862 [Deltaproteobacteria bacterium ADurb.Bin072]|nr:MAG: hypothetical protein BWX71_02862 [Deltaproteobacteria bacterium ADurb.Bin072]